MEQHGIFKVLSTFQSQPVPHYTAMPVLAGVWQHGTAYDLFKQCLCKGTLLLTAVGVLENLCSIGAVHRGCGEGKILLLIF